jgi:hypothetical protein
MAHRNMNDVGLMPHVDGAFARFLRFPAWPLTRRHSEDEI